MIWYDDQKQQGPWLEFETTFEKQYISNIMDVLKRQELLHLDLNSMSVLEYDQQFLSFFTFTSHLHLPVEVLTKMFEDRLYSWIRGRVVVQHLEMLMDVVEAILITKG